MNSDQLSALVRTGLEFHRDGQIEQAGRIYGEVLEHNPIRADALHLFGLVLFQMGEPHSAVAAIERAIALWPSKAHFHNNLAEVYRSLGDHHRATGCLILALRLRPDRFANTDDFDLIYLREGQYDNLRMPPRPPLEPASSASFAETQLALKYQSEGALPLAIGHFFEAVRLAPGRGVEECNLGGALLELNRLPEALHHCREAVRLAPDLPEAWNHLGNVYHAMGQSVDARSSYLESLRLDPNSSTVLNHLGRVLTDALYSEEALTWFRMALEIDPGSVTIRSNTAWILREIGQLDEASRLCEETMALAPDAAEVHVCQGSILHDSQRFEEARKSFEKALELKPDFVLAHQSQGILLTEMGEPKAAEKAFRELLRYQANHSRAHFGLANLFRGKLPEADLAAIHRSIEDPTLPDFARAELHFAAATVYDARKEFGRASEHLRTANRLRQLENARSGRSYSAADHEHFVERMIEVCSTEFFERVEGFGLDSERPVFVFGLPRSGTSLTEQILSSHSQVHGLGETQMSVKKFNELPGSMNSRDDSLTCLARIDRKTTARMSLEYLDKLDAIDHQAKLIVDKLPDNYQYLGFLATLFPKARFIHCRRDLRDIAVSCWSTNFWYLDWPNSFETIASRFVIYQRLMAHWERVLPIPILQIDYEETVADVETTARTLIDWCGLDWEPTCLAFHETRRLVRTASNTQVRQPIYQRSVERWRNYEADMGELFERLEAEVKV